MMETATEQTPAPTDIKTRKKSKREQAKFWDTELTQSEKFLRGFHRQGTKVVKRFLDDRGIGNSADIEVKDGVTRLNLFNSNTRTLMDMLYSNLPSVEVSRAHADANDDEARVAAEIMERLLNTDIADNPKDYDSVLRASLQDRLLPGLGVARVRYEFKEEQFQVPPVMDPNTGQVLQPGYTDTRIVDEQAPVDYFHWQDVLWGWARCYSEVPWIGYRSYLSRDEVKDRFGAEAARGVQYKKQKSTDSDKDESRPEDDSPWQKAEIWEIWDKPTRRVFWFAKGYPKLLDSREDPLKLKHFFPSPEFLMANATTQLYRPVSDYYMSQDLYNEVDILQTRISILTTAVKVVGVYDASCEGVTRMFKEGFENDLIPVDAWAMFAETGGLKGAIDWLPVMDVVNTLDKLRQLRDETIGLLQRVSGMADVMAGGLDNQYEGVGQTQIKAQFGSVRVQALQDCFAQFAADLLQLKAEVICRHFQPESIIKYSNMTYSADAELLQPAVMLLKQPEMAHIRINVRPEQVAMVDYARLKVERTEFLNAMATFMQSSAPLLELDPAAMPVLLQMLQWTMSGFKGSSEIEGVLDKAIEAAQQKAQEAAENPPEDPAAAAAAAEAQAAQQAHQMEMEKEQAKLQGEMQKIQAKQQADMAIRQQDMQMDIQTTREATNDKMREIMAGHQATMAEIQAKFQADITREKVSGQINIQQSAAAAETEMIKDENSADLDIEKEVTKAELKMDEDNTKAVNEIEKIRESGRVQQAQAKESGDGE